MKQNVNVEEAVDQQKFTLDPVQPIELIYKNIKVIAKVEVQHPTEKNCLGKPKMIQEERTILKTCTGRFTPGTFTAIVGPSGCGKTTMLNLLSGRLLSLNLSLFGKLSLNGFETDNLGNFKEHIGYVMQEDLMLPTFTPTETFKFITDMRLPGKSEEQKVELVNKMIQSLGLSKCRDTYIGNNLIRGVSGGQKKRTSIGVQLLINPSIIFLDEPTTGLDSTTSLNLIRLLNGLAKSGRTVISTIHQPSSEIFLEFDRLMLMVDGNTVYNGGARKSIDYFNTLKMPVPIHSNPLDHYMKIMNKEGIALTYMEKGLDYTDEQVFQQFQKKVAFLVGQFKRQQVSVSHTIVKEVEEKRDVQKLSWVKQTWNLFIRSGLNQLRNPMDIIAKIIQAIFFALISIILYERRAQNFNTYDQNLKGAIFFIVMTLAFGGIFGSVNAFNAERAVFIRERLSNTYDTTSYFVGRTLSTIPGITIVPLIFIAMCYWIINLNYNVGIFFYTILSGFLISWMSSAYGLFLSALIADAVVVMALVPVLIVPLLLVGGFFTPLSNVHDVFRPFEYISVFKYGYQAMMQQQYINGAQFAGFANTPANILQTDQYNFDEPLWLNLFLLGAIGLFLKLCALVALKVMSNPQRMNLQIPIQQTNNQHDKIQKSQQVLQSHFGPLLQSQSNEKIKQH